MEYVLKISRKEVGNYKISENLKIEKLVL